MRNLVTTLAKLERCGLKPTICTLLTGFDISVRDGNGASGITVAGTTFFHVDKAEDIGEALHQYTLHNFPNNPYAREYTTTNFGNVGENLFPEAMDIPEQSADVQIQTLIGPPTVRLGCVGVIILNAPMSEVKLPGQEESTLAPAITVNARQSMEVGMNLIHMGKLAEQMLQSQQG